LERERRILEATSQEVSIRIGGRGKKKMVDKEDEWKAYMQRHEQMTQMLIQMM